MTRILLICISCILLFCVSMVNVIWAQSVTIEIETQTICSPCKSKVVKKPVYKKPKSKAKVYKPKIAVNKPKIFPVKVQEQKAKESKEIESLRLENYRLKLVILQAELGSLLQKKTDLLKQRDSLEEEIAKKQTEILELTTKLPERDRKVMAKKP